MRRILHPPSPCLSPLLLAESKESRTPLSRSRVPPVLLLAALLSAPETALAQRSRCAEALGLMIAQASGQATDTSLFIFESRSDADDALRRTTFLAMGSPRCPAAYGARGLIKQRLALTDWVPKEAPGQRVGVRWREDAVYDLGLAAKGGGPTAIAAATVGTQLLLPKKVDMPWLVREVGPGLLAAPVGESEIPDTIRYFWRGRLAAWLWHPTVADSAFSAYQAAGGSPDRAALELARLRLATDVPGGDSLYYGSAASPDSSIVREVRADLAFVADSQELSAFDRVAASNRPQWLRRFWEDRDLESLRPRGSRLREHYRRIGVARTRFRLLSYPRQYELNELWINRDAEYDDRGLMYIRHGEPDATSGAVRSGTCPNISWLYRRPEGNLILHFVARQNPDDFRLVETLANVSGERGATTRVRRAGSTQSCTRVDGLFESRSWLDPIYGDLAGNQSRRNWERELAITTRSRAISTTTDSEVLHFPTALNVAWRAYGLLGSKPGQGRVLVLTSVPAEALAPISENPLAFGFRLRMVARSGPRSVELDSVRHIGAAHAPKPGEMITFTTEIPLQAGSWNVGVALDQPRDSSGEILRDTVVPVPNSAAQALALSDIVLGAETGGHRWMAPDGEFPLTSTGAYRRGRPIPIYYEVAGMRRGAETETEITFVRDDGKGRSVIRFSERADDPIERIRRELNTSKSKPGRYTLTVKIQTADGRKAERQASMIILPER